MRHSIIKYNGKNNININSNSNSDNDMYEIVRMGAPIHRGNSIAQNWCTILRKK